MIKTLLEKITNLLSKINKTNQINQMIIEERSKEILEESYKYFIDRLKKDITTDKIKLYDYIINRMKKEKIIN